jgi:GR25 family glycosyltransferase involved in LPS biosynthesis
MYGFRYGIVADRDMTPLNSTFGFEKIYVLSMPHRTDKRAEMTVLAHQYGFEFEFVDGVDGLALRPNHTHIKAGIYGTAEGHAKVWQKILTSRVSSALIFEDDNDFDMRIREQVSRMQSEWEQIIR